MKKLQEVQARLTVFDFDEITPKKKEFMIKWLRANATALKNHKKGDLSKVFKATLYK